MTYPAASVHVRIRADDTAGLKRYEWESDTDPGGVSNPCRSTIESIAEEVPRR
jgi:hypothetical protein